MPDKIKVKVVQKNSLKVATDTKKTVLVNQTAAIHVRKISDLLDVDVSDKTDGSLLIYDEEKGKFTVSTLLEKQTVNGGHF